MYLHEESRENVSVVVSPEEAQYILEGLQQFHDALDAECHELEQQLEAAGVTPPPPPERVRHEYMPPKN